MQKGTQFYPTSWIGPKIFTTVREKYSPGFIFLYFKTNWKDTYSCFIWRLWCDNFALLWIGLVLTLKKTNQNQKEWELHLTIPNQFKGMLAVVWSYYYWILVGCTTRTLCSFIVSNMCVKWLSYKMCMQHKATNFEFIYFLEEINFLKL